MTAYNILDYVQNELRESRSREFDTGEMGTASQSEPWYGMHEGRYELLRILASNRFSDPEEFERFRRSHNAPDTMCILALGKVAIGYGRGMIEAMEMARDCGYDDRDCLVVFANDLNVISL